MTLPILYKDCPQWVFIADRQADGTLRDISGEADAFVVLTDGKTKVVFESGSVDNPLINHTEDVSYKRFYLSAEILEAWKATSIKGTGGFRNELYTKDVTDIAIDDVWFDLQTSIASGI